jgi:hypothetical protein
MRAFFKPISKDFRWPALSDNELKPAPSHGKLAAAIGATEAAKEKDASWNLELHGSLGAGSSSDTMPKGGATEDEEGVGAPKGSRKRTIAVSDDEDDDSEPEEKEEDDAAEFEGYEEEEEEEEQGAQKAVELGTECYGTAARMYDRWRGAVGQLTVLRTDTEEQRQKVYELTDILVTPLPFKAAYAVGQSATQSPKWIQQRSRRTLNHRHLVEALKAGPTKPVAELLEKQDGGCGFFYGGKDYCVKHVDKSSTNQRVMLRLTQTPTQMHYLMIQGDNRMVYNIQFQGPCAYGGLDDAAILAKRQHAVPMPEADGNGLITILTTLTDTPLDFRTKMMAALEEVQPVEEPWAEIKTAGNRKGTFDHITKSQKSKGGKATIASHGDQLGNCGRKSPADSLDEFSPLLSSRYSFPLLRSRSLNRCNWATRGDVHGVQGYDCSDCARLHYQSLKGEEPPHDQEVDA